MSSFQVTVKWSTALAALAPLVLTCPPPASAQSLVETTAFILYGGILADSKDLQHIDDKTVKRFNNTIAVTSESGCEVVDSNAYIVQSREINTQLTYFFNNAILPETKEFAGPDSLWAITLNGEENVTCTVIKSGTSGHPEIGEQNSCSKSLVIRTNIGNRDRVYPSGLGRLADPFAREMMCPLSCKLKGTHGHDDNSFGSRAPAALDGC
ncbi:MAG TPA: hypothetical protein VH684_17065, partial [Xanthobacteraceae bacterium]|jgi:hypothetical protein